MHPEGRPMTNQPNPKTVIANEFTTVTVEKVHTRNGERLEIVSPRLGYRIQLDPMELESLSWQPKDTFSQFLHRPYGPQ